MQLSDIDRVYAIEVAGHRAPWGREILSDCVFVGYDCRVLEIHHDPAVELVSYIICRNSEAICHVLNLCVAPTAQRRGYGEFLLEQVIKSLPRPDIQTIVLEVRPSNQAALHLYKKMGFLQVGTKRGYYREGPEAEDAVVLQKQLQRSLWD